MSDAEQEAARLRAELQRVNDELNTMCGADELEWSKEGGGQTRPRRPGHGMRWVCVGAAGTP